MLPLLFTKNVLYVLPKYVSPPGNASVRSFAALDPSSFPGRLFGPYPAGRPNPFSSGIAAAVDVVSENTASNERSKGERPMIRAL